MSASETELSASPNQNQIVHESEAQRQYIRLRMPAHVEIDGFRYTAKDLSSGGMAVQGFEKLPRKNSRHDVKLILPFFDFALDISLTAEVVHTDKKDKSAGFRFVDMNQNQLSILNHVLSAFIAGDIISGDSILKVVARENFAKVRQHHYEDDNATFQNIKKYAHYALFVLLTFALSFFIIANILDRLLIVRSAQAYVTAPFIDMNAPSSGQFSYVMSDEEGVIKKGQVIGNIAVKIPSETGIANINTLPITSPCDCYIQKAAIYDNNYVTEGQPLFTLIDQNAQTSIVAIVPMEDATRLKTGTKTKIRLAPSGKEVLGTVSHMEIKEHKEGLAPALQSLVTITPDQPLSHDNINHPASVEFFL